MTDKGAYDGDGQEATHDLDGRLNRDAEIDTETEQATLQEAIQGTEDASTTDTGDQQTNPAYDVSGETVYHGTDEESAENLVENGVQEGMLQSRDRGFFGEGFYVAVREDTAETYGDTVVEIDIPDNADVLNAGETFGDDASVVPEEPPSWHDDFIEWHLQEIEEAAVWEKIDGVEREDVVGDARDKMTPGTDDFERENWYGQVTEYADEEGYDVVYWVEGEVVVLDTESVEIEHRD